MIALQPLTREHPPGTSILAVRDDLTVHTTRTRSGIWDLHGTEVVLLEGHAGAFLASRCFVVSVFDELATLRARAEQAERALFQVQEAAKDLRAKLDAVKSLRAEAERLRGALEGLMLSRDASWTGGHDWEEALEAAAAALAGEASEETTMSPQAGTCCSCGYTEGEETECSERSDKTHCAHWWDGPDTTPEKASQP